jgi:hypothetical protein
MRRRTRRQKYIYDATTLWNQRKSGHTHCDAFSDGERRALLEYLNAL